MRAHDALFMNVASYFRDSRNLEREDKVISTDLPPIYFQHQGLDTPRHLFSVPSARADMREPLYRTLYDNCWVRNS